MAVVLNASGVNRVRFTVINNMMSLFHPQREIHYIGGTDILPPPLEPEEEAYVLSQLDTKRSAEAKALLIERNLGEFEGKKYAEYEKLKFWDYKLNNDSYGVEPVKDILKRTSSFLNNLKEKDYKTVLIVSHAATIRAINYNIIGYDSNTDFLEFKPTHGKVYEYEI